MEYNKLKEKYSHLEEIPVLKLECTFGERYFEKYDKLVFNFNEFQCITRSFTDENGHYKMTLIPIGVENPSAIYNNRSLPPELHELHNERN